MKFVTLVLSVVLLSACEVQSPRYQIYQSGYGTMYTDSYTRKDGCISFTPKHLRGAKVEMCGSYRIIEFPRTNTGDLLL